MLHSIRKYSHECMRGCDPASMSTLLLVARFGKDPDLG
jgi:hypothetical protein